MAKPRKIFIVRHGQSEGNIDKSVYNRKPDYAINLTDVGKQQAYEAGEKIREIVGSVAVGAYISPFYRTRQTWEELSKPLWVDMGFMREDPRLREQEWTTCLRVESKLSEERERDDYGPFYYRFESGESCADVYDRMSSFLDTLHRDFEKERFPEYLCIIGHGMANRVLLMRWFHWSVEQFELLRNPKNAEFYTLILQPNGRYQLSEPPKQYEERRRKF